MQTHRLVAHPRVAPFAGFGPVCRPAVDHRGDVGAGLPGKLPAVGVGQRLTGGVAAVLADAEFGETFIDFGDREGAAGVAARGHRHRVGLLVVDGAGYAQHPRGLEHVVDFGAVIVGDYFDEAAETVEQRRSVVGGECVGDVAVLDRPVGLQAVPGGHHDRGACAEERRRLVDDRFGGGHVRAAAWFDVQVGEQAGEAGGLFGGAAAAVGAGRPSGGVHRGPGVDGAAKRPDVVRRRFGGHDRCPEIAAGFLVADRDEFVVAVVEGFEEFGDADGVVVSGSPITVRMRSAGFCFCGGGWGRC